MVVKVDEMGIYDYETLFKMRYVFKMRGCLSGDLAT